MMTILKPTKMKFLAMALIWFSIWSAHKLEDIIGDPIIKHVSPQFRGVTDRMVQELDASKGDEETSYIKAGVVVYLSEWVSRAFVSYLCACVIIGLEDRKRRAEPVGPANAG